jgi:hypothetical protein
MSDDPKRPSLWPPYALGKRVWRIARCADGCEIGRDLVCSRPMRRLLRVGVAAASVGCMVAVVGLGASSFASGGSGPALRAVYGRQAHHGRRHRHKRHKSKAVPRVRAHSKDGPGCAAWSISLSCVCPKSVVREATGAPPNLPPGDGWVEITLTYPTFGGPVATCSGGIAIENSSGAVVASAGYSAAAHTGLEEGPGGAPGVASGSVTTFALAPGDWTAISDDQRVATSREAFAVTAGQAAKLTVVLKS